MGHLSWRVSLTDDKRNLRTHTQKVRAAGGRDGREVSDPSLDDFLLSVAPLAQFVLVSESKFLLVKRKGRGILRTPWAGGKLSKFGKYCKDNALSRETLAKDLGVTPSYISMLAHGKAKPGGRLAVEIQRWTEKNPAVQTTFDPSDWYE